MNGRRLCWTGLLLQPGCLSSIALAPHPLQATAAAAAPAAGRRHAASAAACAVARCTRPPPPSPLTHTRAHTHTRRQGGRRAGGASAGQGHHSSGVAAQAWAALPRPHPRAARSDAVPRRAARVRAACSPPIPSATPCTRAHPPPCHFPPASLPLRSPRPPAAAALPTLLLSAPPPFLASIATPVMFKTTLNVL